jgi:tRNA(fMet)-specific endonuclease VapC
LREFLDYVTVLDWPAAAALVYGRLRAHLERSGRAIGAMDMMIAAHAIQENAALVIRNRGEFERVGRA